MDRLRWKLRKERQSWMCIEDKNVAFIEEVIFLNKQNISWNEVETYLKRFVEDKYIVEETKDVICIASDFPDEYTESKYTKSLRGSIAKAKANASQVIGKMIVVATNKRWVKNKDRKHDKDAKKGWYRYDTYFGMPVQGSGENEARVNIFRATLVVRISLNGLFLHGVTSFTYGYFLL